MVELFHENQVFEKMMMQHDYDVMIGPVADDNIMETIQLYIANILTAVEAVERLRYRKVNNQVSFHTEKALQEIENGLWAESAEYIADRYYEEISSIVSA